MSVTIDTKVLDDIVGGLGYKTEDAVRETAQIVQGNAAMAAPYDTGALSNSIVAESESEANWIVRDGVSYGLFNEVGTYKMPPRPFLVPAVESEREPFMQRLKRAIDR